jgi:hypothetical protein
MNPIKYLNDARDAAFKASRRYDNHARTLSDARDVVVARDVLLHLLNWEHSHLRYFDDGDVAQVRWKRADGSEYGISSDLNRQVPGWYHGGVIEYANTPPQVWLDYVKGKL